MNPVRCGMAWALSGVLLCLPAGAEISFPEAATAILPSGDEFLLELAVTPEQQRFGYMEREKVGKNQGMLFLFGVEGYHGIWMKNCKVGLDIVWLDRGLRVVDTAPDRPPCPPEGSCPSVQPDAPAFYVLELAAGRVAETGLKPGDQIVVLPASALRSRGGGAPRPGE